MNGDVCVVMPTVREYNRIESYVSNARNQGFDTNRLTILLVTEDWCDTAEMERMLDEMGVDGEVFDSTRRDAWFESNGIGDYKHLIPAKSHAQTSFGLLYMWANDFEYGIFIDDDTRPQPGTNFFETHIENLESPGKVERVQSDTQWVNVLYDSVDRHGLYPRGYPYSAMDESIQVDLSRPEDVVASQGLWTGVPDLDAARILSQGDLSGQGNTRLQVEDYGESFIAAEGSYLTICSMNLAFKREIVPAFYQLPMDDNPWGIGRFDDIWSGVFLKRVCDVLGKQIISGQPLCVHEKAPRSTFDDLATELPGLELNEHLWEITQEAEVPEKTIEGVYRGIANALLEVNSDEYRNADFLSYIGEAMQDWLTCLKEI